MKNASNLLNSWGLPDRTQERVQVTLRLNFDEYARLHALKAVYPNRAVNDFMNDLIHAGLDEVIEALPSRKISDEEAAHVAGSPEEYEDLRGAMTGPRATFDHAYRSILMTKSEDDTGVQEAA